MSERDLKMGERMALELIPLIGDCVRQADDPVHLWAGLLMGLAGMAGHDLGTEVKETLFAAGGLIGAEIAQSRQQ
jgi:hypothetical protein